MNGTAPTNTAGSENNGVNDTTRNIQEGSTSAGSSSGM
jgi:hypothetical protein